MVRLAIAKQFAFVREVPEASNAGRWVEAMQRIGGTTKGQPWCACYVSTVIGIAYQGKPPISFTAGCDVWLAEARAKSILHDTPEAGDVFLRLASEHDADHTGLVREVLADGKWTTWEGNANEGGGREGVGVFSLTRPIGKKRCVFIRLPESAAA